jgi:hypothetical protein
VLRVVLDTNVLISILPFTDRGQSRPPGDGQSEAHPAAHILSSFRGTDIVTPREFLVDPSDEKHSAHKFLSNSELGDVSARMRK